MKRINLSFWILCITLVILCSSCGFFGPQKYVCEVENVESIQIVRIDDYVEGEYRYEYTVLSHVFDQETFVNKLNSLEHSVNWGEPSQLDINYIVIRIDYSNGDYDLIYPNAQWFNRSGVNEYGFFFFDEEQFNELISDYTTE